MKRSISIKNSNRSGLTSVVLGVVGSLAIQILGAITVVNLILNGVLNETGMEAAVHVIRAISVISGALITWYTAKEGRKTNMIVSCIATIVAWLAPCLGLWGIDTGAFLVATVLCIVAYGGVAVLLSKSQNKPKWGRVKKHYR